MPGFSPDVDMELFCTRADTLFYLRSRLAAPAQLVVPWTRIKPFALTAFETANPARGLFGINQDPSDFDWAYARPRRRNKWHWRCASQWTLPCHLTIMRDALVHSSLKGRMSWCTNPSYRRMNMLTGVLMFAMHNGLGTGLGYFE